MFIGKFEYYGHVETTLYIPGWMRDPPTPERREARYKVSGGVILGTSAHRRRPSTPKTVYFNVLAGLRSHCLLQDNYRYLPNKIRFCLPMYLIFYAYFRHVAA